MASQDQDQDAAHDSVSRSERGSRRRKRAVGVVATAAILGGGIYFGTETMTGVTTTTIRDSGALAPIVPVVSGSVSDPQPAAQPSPRQPVASKRVAARASRDASSSASESRAVAERIEAARSAAAKDGFPLQRPLVPPKVPAQAVPPAVTNVGSLPKDGATMRVVTARYDLTGQRELAWAADDGEQVGDARCTQNFHFSNGGPARERPTMLLCWHTSATRSVVTLAVTRQGRPSKAASVAIIDQHWAALAGPDAQQPAGQGVGK